MSDDGSPVVEDKKKRGRPSKSPVKEAKRRGRPPAEKNNVAPKSDDEDDAPAPVKRGRGRPKGTHKKKVNNRQRNVINFILDDLLIN